MSSGVMSSEAVKREACAMLLRDTSSLRPTWYGGFRAPPLPAHVADAQPAPRVCDRGAVRGAERGGYRVRALLCAVPLLGAAALAGRQRQAQPGAVEQRQAPDEREALGGVVQDVLQGARGQQPPDLRGLR